MDDLVAVLCFVFLFWSLWPLTIPPAMAYAFFMIDWRAGLLGIAIWAFCLWRLREAKKKWPLYFGMGAFLSLTVVRFFMMSIPG
jgi:hypothetical protein